MSIWFENVRLIRPGESIAAGCLLVEGGSITCLAPPGEACPPEAERIDGGGRLLGPGLIDVHTHGIATYQFDNGPEALLAGVRLLPRYGTTCVTPTLVPMAGAGMLDRLARLAEALPALSGAAVPGFHLEGPFMALAGAGCATLPGDVGLLEELLAACRQRVLIMSISPETPGILPVIERLTAHGVIPFITHTRASIAQTQAAIDAGARHATHFYDVFPLPAETDPGVRPVGAVETLLADPRVTLDFIADGTHVHPVAIRAALAAKGFSNILLITDANIGAGLPAGEYDTPWGYRVRVQPGNGARITGDHPHAGGLAGSALTMNVGMANLLNWLNLPPAQTWAMGTANPARLLNLSNKGRLAESADADFVLWNDDFTPEAVWVSGVRCRVSELELWE